MASETVLSDHSTAPEEVDKKVQPEVKKMETEHVSAPKESADILKPEESPILTAACAEAEPKIEEKQIEPPVTEEANKISADEKPKDEDHSAEVAAHLAESTEQKIKDKPVGLPPSEEEKKTEDVLTLEAENQEESRVESIEENPGEPAEIVEVPESSSAEVVDNKVEKTEELPAKEVEAAQVKDVIASETVCKCKGEETSEQSEVTEQIEKEPPAAEPIETVAAETHTKLPGEDEFAKEETVAIESLEQVKSEKPKAQVEEKDVECSTTDEANEEKEPAKETVKIEGISEEKVVEPGKIEENTEIPETKTEEKSVVGEELKAQCEEKPSQHVTGSIPPPEVAEKAAEEEVTSRDIDLLADNGNKKGETVASKQKDLDRAINHPLVEGKVDNEATKEPEKKIEETAQTTEAKLEEEKLVDEAAKTNIIQNSESIKHFEDRKTEGDDPKEETVPVKTQKQSKNIVKMVKQSLVKAKKAIMGKSHNSKTPADDTNK